jgi:hypothetical protein
MLKEAGVIASVQDVINGSIDLNLFAERLQRPLSNPDTRGRIISALFSAGLLGMAATALSLRRSASIGNIKVGL